MSHSAETLLRAGLVLGQPDTYNRDSYPFIIGRPDGDRNDAYPVVIGKPGLDLAGQAIPAAARHLISPWFTQIGYPVGKLREIAAQQGAPPAESVEKVRDWLEEMLSQGISPAINRPTKPEPIDYAVSLDRLDRPDTRAWISPKSEIKQLDERLAHQAAVECILQSVTPLQRELLEGRYGLVPGTDPLTLRALGEQHHRSPEEMRRRIVRAARNVRQGSQ